MMKFPEDDHKYLWTFHSKKKMVQYAVGPNAVKRIIRFPERKEEGIAPQTIAVMRAKGKEKNRKEVWVMYRLSSAKKKIISVWIYPGKSPEGQAIFVPDEAWEELEKAEEAKRSESP